MGNEDNFETHGPGEPDEISTEGSDDTLAHYDEELRQHDALPAETAERTDEQLATAISDALANVGLYQADEIDADTLRDLYDAVYEKLTPHTAESLYFETYRRSRKWLGNEHITPKRVFSLAEAWSGIGSDPEAVRKELEAKAIKALRWAGIDTDQILDLLTGSADQAQTVIRTYFLLFSETRLKDYRTSLHDNASPESPKDIKQVVQDAQAILNTQLAELEQSKDRDFNLKTSMAGWDSIAEDLYERIKHRLETNRGIATMVIRALESKDVNPQPFLDDAVFFDE